MHVSDPHDKRWLADDPNFLASLNDLDRGLVDDDAIVEEEETPENAFPPSVAPPQPPPVRAPAPAPPAAARPLAAPPGPAARRAARPINPARALDPAHVLDTAPAARPVTAPSPAPPLAAAAHQRAVAAPAPVRLVPAGTFGDPEDEPPPPPALAFTRASPPEARARRPLLDLFPPSALEPVPPPLSLGTAVGPQLPPPRPRAVPRPEREAPSPLDPRTYETFYGLREKPFSLSTDPRFQYQSAAHERAGQEILAAIRKRGGPAVLTGPLGMGKTTLCRALVPEIDRRIVTSLVLEPLQSIDDLMKTMLVDFGVIAREDLAGAANLSRERVAGALNSFLESLVPLNASAAVIIDEAQNVPVSLLGDLAALLGGSAARALQLVLVGQPALTALLKHGELRALDASVARRTELGPLAPDEISNYVMHRLSIAGGQTRIEFDEAAIARLFELSAGSPRLVNLLCDRALTRGQAASAAVIDGVLIEEAATDLGLQVAGADRPGVLGAVLLVAGFALLVLAGAAGALWVSRDAVARTIQQWEQMPLPPGGPIRRLPVPLAPIPPPAGVQ